MIDHTADLYRLLSGTIMKYLKKHHGVYNSDVINALALATADVMSCCADAESHAAICTDINKWIAEKIAFNLKRIKQEKQTQTLHN